jgi:hypothetical protein
MKRCRDLLLVVVLAAMTFGGSFTCKGSTNDDITSQPTKRATK